MIDDYLESLKSIQNEKEEFVHPDSLSNFEIFGRRYLNHHDLSSFKFFVSLNGTLWFKYDDPLHDVQLEMDFYKTGEYYAFFGYGPSVGHVNSNIHKPLSRFLNLIFKSLEYDQARDVG